MTGAAEDEFLLKWHDHHQSFFLLVEELVMREQLTDVTLACGSGEDQQLLSAHSLMLSVCRLVDISMLNLLPKITLMQSVLPDAAVREPTQGEASHHPPARGFRPPPSAAPSLHVPRRDLHQPGRPRTPHRNRPLPTDQRTCHGST